MPENTTDWDAAAEVDDVQVPEYTPTVPSPTVAEQTAAFQQMIQDGVERERLVPRKSPIEQANEFTDKLVEAQASALEGEPVSESNEAINLPDPPPPALAVIHLDGVDVISTAERIQVVREGAGLEVVAPPPAVPVMTARMQDQLAAEQEAGRRALERNQARAAAHPRPEPSAEELRRKGGNVEVFRPTDMSNVTQRHLLNTPSSKKGEGY